MVPSPGGWIRLQPPTTAITGLQAGEVDNVLDCEPQALEWYRVLILKIQSRWGQVSLWLCQRSAKNPDWADYSEA